MIKIDKTYGEVPQGLLSDGAQKQIRIALQEKQKHNANNYYYAHETVKEKLRKIYHEKCAYCESKVAYATYYQVEHYRSKKTPQECGDHLGYYWLAYEWSNLLLICPTCNQAKSNHFPIVGLRVSHPPKEREEWRTTAKNLLNEKAVLLNPEIDNPSLHLFFTTSGEMSFSSDRGETTIELCKLNRKKLSWKRKMMIDGFRSEIRDQLHQLYEDWLEGQAIPKNQQELNRTLKSLFFGIFRRIWKIQNPEEEFSLLGQCMVEQFEDFFIKKFSGDASLTKEMQSLFRQAFKLYQKEITT